MSLAEEINTATRAHHTALNRLLLHLLPRALPPYSGTPELYAYGMAYFLPIYAAFESSSFTPFYSAHSKCPAILPMHIAKLQRSRRLERDLKCLLPVTYLQALSSAGANKTENDSETLPYLGTFIAHIHESLSKKPHVHLAYTWVFYMALFSGGRYIRAKLQSAGDDFWCTTFASNTSATLATVELGDTEEHMTVPLSFWKFCGSTDGEDLKAEYKRYVLEIEPALTAAECEDIISEAVDIMKRLLVLVCEIEAVITDGGEADIKPYMVDPDKQNRILTYKSKPQAIASSRGAVGNPSLLILLLKHLLPMGLVELLSGTKKCFFPSTQSSKVPDAVAVQSS